MSPMGLGVYLPMCYSKKKKQKDYIPYLVGGVIGAGVSGVRTYNKFFSYNRWCFEKYKANFEKGTKSLENILRKSSTLNDVNLSTKQIKMLNFSQDTKSIAKEELQNLIDTRKQTNFVDVVKTSIQDIVEKRYKW